jgi:hypothetical protein
LDGPLAPNPRWSYVVAVDLSSRRDTSVVAVCHLELLRREGLGGGPGGAESHIDLDAAGGEPVVLSEVEDAIFHAARSFGAPVVADPWQALRPVGARRWRMSGL